MRCRNYGLATLGLGAFMIVGQALGAGAPQGIAPGSSAQSGTGQTVSAYTLDDGKDLLPRASIGIDQAVAAAQTAASGTVGEIDLETVDGVLVFNVDVGDRDVKVDASTGAVVSADHDE